MRRLTTAVPALLLLFGAAPPTGAGNELTIIGGYRFGGSFDVAGDVGAWDFEDASATGLIFDREYRDNTQWEIFYSRQSTQAEFDGTAISDPIVDVETSILEIGGTYLWDGASVQPYLAATLGATRMRVDSTGSESDTYWSGSIGLGLRVMPGSRLGLRLELRAHGAFTDEDSDLFCRTGPDANICAVRVVGKLFQQLEAFAGVTVRF